MRLNSRGELRGDSVVGDSRGDIEDGDFFPRGRRGRSCWRRFSLSILTRSSLSPVWSPWWSCLTGTARVSWLPPCWAIPELDGDTRNTTPRLGQTKEGVLGTVPESEKEVWRPTRAYPVSLAYFPPSVSILAKFALLKDYAAKPLAPTHELTGLWEYPRCACGENKGGGFREERRGAGGNHLSAGPTINKAKGILRWLSNKPASPSSSGRLPLVNTSEVMYQ